MCWRPPLPNMTAACGGFFSSGLKSCLRPSSWESSEPFSIFSKPKQSTHSLMPEVIACQPRKSAFEPVEQ